MTVNKIFVPYIVLLALSTAPCAAQLSGKNPTTTKTVEAKKAVDALKKNPQKSRAETVVVYNEDFEKGEELFRLNRPKSAIPYFEKSLESEHVDPAVYVYLGVCYYQIEDYEKSLAVCEQGLAKEGTDKKILAYNAGNSCYALGNYARADASYAIALNEDEQYSPAVLNRANALLRLDRLADARKNYARYLELEPETPQRERIEIILRLLDAEIERRAKEKPELVYADSFVENEKPVVPDSPELVRADSLIENEKPVVADSAAPDSPELVRAESLIENEKPVVADSAAHDSPELVHADNLIENEKPVASAHSAQAVASDSAAADAPERVVAEIPREKQEPGVAVKSELVRDEARAPSLPQAASQKVPEEKVTESGFGNAAPDSGVASRVGGADSAAPVIASAAGASAARASQGSQGERSAAEKIDAPDLAVAPAQSMRQPAGGSSGPRSSSEKVSAGELEIPADNSARSKSDGKGSSELVTDAEQQARFAEENRLALEAEKARLAEESRRELEAEKARLAEEARKNAEADAARLAAEEAERRRSEEMRLALEVEKARLAEESRKALEAEKARLAEEAKKAAELERARIEAEEAKKALEAERARIAEEARKNAELEKARRELEAEKARLAEESRKELEAEKARLAAEEARLALEAEKARLAEESRKAVEAERARIAAEEAERRKTEEARLAVEAEKLRQADEARKAAEAEAARVRAEEAEKARIAEEAERRRQEEARIAENAVAAERARAAAEEAERRKAEEARIAEEAEKARLAEEARKKAELEANQTAEAEGAQLTEEQQRQAELAEAQRKQAEEAAQKKAEEEQRKAEAEKARQEKLASWPKQPVVMLGMSGAENFTPDGDGQNDRMTFSPKIDYIEEPPESWTFSILDPHGNPFRTIRGMGTPPEKIEWDGTSDMGEVVLSKNTYTATFTVTPSKTDRERIGAKTVQTSEEIHTGLLLEVIVPGHEWKMVVNSINFVPNEALSSEKLTKEQIDWNSKTLDEIAAQIKDHPGAKVVIVEGYANNISGTERENREELLPLSQLRADAIVEELVKRGVSRNLLEATGKGGANPIASQSDRANWYKNRRVEFRIKQ